MGGLPADAPGVQKGELSNVQKGLEAREYVALRCV